MNTSEALSGLHFDNSLGNLNKPSPLKNNTQMTFGKFSKFQNMIFHPNRPKPLSLPIFAYQNTSSFAKLFSKTFLR
jgi:hypothetical protein